MEIWKPIPGSRYEASSLGRIRSPRGNILKPQKHPMGYHMVAVSLEGDATVKSYTVHRLVALAFLGPRPDGLDIAHGNCIKTDNRPSNLRYATRSENIQDSVILGLWPRGAGRTAIYPWHGMEVGETFTANAMSRNSVFAMVRTAGLRHDRLFRVTGAANDDGSWTVTRVA